MMKLETRAILPLLALGIACASSKESTFNMGGGNATGGTGGIGGSGLSGAAGGQSGISTGPTGTGSIMTGAGGSIGAGGTGGTGVNADAACAAEAQDTKAIPVDIFIMLDRSGSMKCEVADDACGGNPTNIPPTRWTAVSEAINAFVASPDAAGIGVGIGFFPPPNGDQCSVPGYAAPSVPIAPLPGSAMPVSNAIATTMPNGNTPTTPALTGAIEYATSYGMATPGRTAAVLFVTDGIPNGCNSDIPSAAAAAAAGFTRIPSIKTYVVGLGQTAALDEIALAGSGGATHYIPATGNVTATLTAALKQISSGITCDYALPAIPGRPLDLGAVNVEVRVGMGMPQFVGKVDDAAACGSAFGWFYDVNPPGMPTKITLCPQSCEPLKMTEGSSLKVLVGCASRPPN